MQASGPGASSAATVNPLTDEQLEIVRAAAIARWEATGISDTQADWLRQTSWSVADLPGDLLGMAFESGIVVDLNGAGYGWFIDATPLADEEFDNGVTVAGALSSRMDLVTVVAHELGHLLGLDDLDSDLDVMSDRLSPGIRRVPSADAIDLLMAQF